MKLARHLAVIGTSAAVAALAAGLFVPPAASAGGDDAPLLGAFLEPKPFDVKGVTLSVDIDRETARPGAELAATLTAANPREGEETRAVRVLMHVTPVSAPMSRMPLAPRLAWSAEMSVRLAKGETKALALRPGIPVQEGEVVTFTIVADGRAALVARHATVSQAGAIEDLPAFLRAAKREPS